MKLWRCPPFASWIRSGIICRTQNLSWKWIHLRLCNYLDISSYIWVKIFASREEMLFFGWSGPDHGRAAAETVHWLPRPRSHSAIGTRYTAPLLIQHFPKIFSYTYSVDVMCHVNNLVNMRPILPHCPARCRPGPACCQPPQSLVEKLHYFCFI